VLASKVSGHDTLNDTKWQGVLEHFLPDFMNSWEIDHLNSKAGKALVSLLVLSILQD